MKRTLWLIIIMLLLSFCSIPFQAEFSYAYEHSKTSPCESEDGNDDAVQTTEHISINYARHNKRVKIEKHVKVIGRQTANNAVLLHTTLFNYNGILNESLKREYAGEDPININM